MLDFTNTTLVMVDGTGKEFSINEDIISKTLKIANFKQVLHFTSNTSNKSSISKIVYHQLLNYYEYQHFCVYFIPQHIHSDFALYMQNDGFIINPHHFDAEYFNYDYIGAPWPANSQHQHLGSHSAIVGNGGFSLRSKKLLQNFIKIPLLQMNEDSTICIRHRKSFEKLGINFAPISIAKKFSIEFPIDDTHTLDTVFGFHGKGYANNALKILTDNTCIIK